jgi:hypothetical protein
MGSLSVKNFVAVYPSRFGFMYELSLLNSHDSILRIVFALL